MFRVFLKKKIETKTAKDYGVPSNAASVPGRERRRYERFDMDHKHLTIQNESDILSVRDLSLQGFSSEVSPRFFERVSKNDVFEARLHYTREMYDLVARVAWKAGSTVGFQLLEAPSETQLFLRRLLSAAKIGNTLKKQEFSNKSLNPVDLIKDWYHSPEGVDLFVWRKTETGSVTAWQLTAPTQFIEWSDSLGLVTGSLASSSSQMVSQAAEDSGTWLRPDLKTDAAKKQLAIDVLMALRDPIRDELVATMTTPDGGA